MKEGRKFIYEESPEGEVEVCFEGFWNMSSINRMVHKVPRHFKIYKQKMLKEAIEKDGKRNNSEQPDESATESAAKSIPNGAVGSANVQRPTKSPGRTRNWLTAPAAESKK